MNCNYRFILDWSIVRTSIALACALFGGCDFTFVATAAPPIPTVVGQPSNAIASIVSLEIPDGDICSIHPGLKDFCVKGMRAALDEGMKSVVERFFRLGTREQGDYFVAFRYLELRHSPTSGFGAGGSPSVQLSLRWQFTVFNRRGAQVLTTAETTVGPEQIVSLDAGDIALSSLLRAVVDRTGQVLAESRLSQTTASAPASPVPRAATACIPGATQACVGPGGCKGGQTCVSNGSRFGAWDCGGK